MVNKGVHGDEVVQAKVEVTERISRKEVPGLFMRPIYDSRWGSFFQATNLPTLIVIQCFTQSFNAVSP